MLSALTGLLGSYLEARVLGKAAGEIGAYLDRWARLLGSIAITSYVTFLVVWGATGLGVIAAGKNCWLALVAGFLTAMFVTGAIVYQLWVRSPLTKGIAIALPSRFVEDVMKENVTITERS